MRHYLEAAQMAVLSATEKDEILNAHSEFSAARNFAEFIQMIGQDR